MKRSRRRYLLLIPAWLVFVVLLAEGGLRVAAYFLRRDDGIVLASRPGVHQIYCVGDSFTWGLGVQRDEAYPQVLQKRLDAAYGAGVFNVVNHGLNGLSSSNIPYAIAKLVRESDPWLIVVLAGWNVNNTDFERLADSRHEQVSWTTRADNVLTHLRVYRLAKHVVTMPSRTELLAGQKLVPQSQAMDLYTFRGYQEIALNNLRASAELARQLDVPLLFLNYPYQDLPKNEYYHVLFGRSTIDPADYIIPDRGPDEIAIHSVIRTVGRETGVPVIDLHDVFTRDGRDELLQRGNDWHHPTAAGHALMADAVFEFIAERVPPPKRTEH